MSNPKVFLGGTVDSKWRETIIPLLRIDYFNPLVEDWTPECQAEEIKQRQECDYCLYVITPKMTGVYSIAEVIDDSNKRPEKTIFCFLHEDGEEKFTVAQVKSLRMVSDMVKNNKAKVFDNLYVVAAYLNGEDSSSYQPAYTDWNRKFK